MREAHDRITDLGGEVVAISSMTTNDAKAGASVAALPFTLLADPTHSAIDAYGVLHHDEPEGRVIARPAIFLIDRKGFIRYAHTGEHPRDRPALGAVLLALESLA